MIQRFGCALSNFSSFHGIRVDFLEPDLSGFCHNFLHTWPATFIPLLLPRTYIIQGLYYRSYSTPYIISVSFSFWWLFGPGCCLFHLELYVNSVTFSGAQCAGERRRTAISLLDFGQPYPRSHWSSQHAVRAEQQVSFFIHLFSPPLLKINDSFCMIRDLDLTVYCTVPRGWRSILLLTSGILSLDHYTRLFPIR